MSSNKVMETTDRELCGRIVKQRTRDAYFSLGDIVGIVNLDRLSQGKQAVQFSHFTSSENTSEFIVELEKETGNPAYYRATKSSRGWIHPFLALKFLTHYNPKFEIQVYKWVFDYLIDNRIKSSDSFNKMSGVLFKYSVNKAKFAKNIQIVASEIKTMIGAEDWNKATEIQLKRRDELQNLIADLVTSLGDCRQGITLAYKVYKDKYLTHNNQILI